MDLSHNVKKRRLELKMSQQELADALGYKSRSAIAKIESGENDIPRAKLLRFAQALDTSVEYLLTGIDSISAAAAGRVPGTAAPAFRRDTAGRQKNIAVFLAGGKSTRSLQNIPNQFVNILGKPMIIYGLEVYQRHPIIDEIYVVCLRGWKDILESYIEQYGITKFAGIIPGGDTGILSVKNAVEYLQDDLEDDDIVMFQEATRPLITEEIISKLLLTCQSHDNALVCESMYDNIQFQRSDSGFSYVDRTSLLCMQSPEAYRAKLLLRAFEQAEQSDDESLLKETYLGLMLDRLGYELNFCEGIRNNIKAVRQEDVAMLTALIKQKA